MLDTNHYVICVCTATVWFVKTAIIFIAIKNKWHWTCSRTARIWLHQQKYANQRKVYLNVTNCVEFMSSGKISYVNQSGFVAMTVSFVSICLDLIMLTTFSYYVFNCDFIFAKVLITLIFIWQKWHITIKTNEFFSRAHNLTWNVMFKHLFI